MQKNIKPSLTIIICTYNRADIIIDCLRSLKTQSISPENFNVLLVDNNSTDNTQHAAKGLKKELSNLKIVSERRQGLSFARNSGLNHSRTPWVAYLDDDAIAQPNWIEIILKTIDTERFDAFGGHYLPWYRDGKVKWFLDEYGTNKTWIPIDKTQVMEKNHFSGGNAVYKREAALSSGGFPVDLGMKGDQLGYSEENYLQDQMRSRGYVIGFVPEMHILHLVPKKKQELSWFKNRMIAEGRSYLKANNVKLTFAIFLRILKNFLGTNIRNSAESARRLIDGKYMLQNAYIKTIAPLYFQREVTLQILKTIIQKKVK